MFNFKKLKLVRAGNAGSISSFVGIRRGLSGDLEFSLPKGFDSFPDGNFDETKKLFFRMYKTFNRFANDMQNKELDKKSTGKDNIETNGNGYSFKDSEDNDVLIYSKISLIENMLNAYRDLSMDFIEKSIGKSDQLDYKNIDQYMDNAIFLENDVVFIDQINADRYMMHYQPNSLITLFCFIIRELEKELENPIDSRVNELADFFVDHNLSPDQSLFDEATFESTILTLKDILHDIDKSTAYKDDRYWILFGAIESFLYGELNMETTFNDGVFWGINNFFQVWEDMCNTYAFANFSILFADTDISYMGNRVGNYSLDAYHKIYRQGDIEYPFYINFRKNKRWMRPDLVQIIHSESKNIFTNAIHIEIKKNADGRTINFDVRLIDKSQEKLFTYFCLALDKTKNSGSRKRNRKGGFVSFLNYFPHKLETQKNRLLTRSELASTSTPTKARIIDWKYMELSDFWGHNKKVTTDVTKQLCYEFCLSKLKIGKSDNPRIQKIESIFAIPIFSIAANSDMAELSNYQGINELVTKNGIKIFNVDFYAAQEAYLKND